MLMHYFLLHLLLALALELRNAKNCLFKALPFPPSCRLHSHKKSSRIEWTSTLVHRPMMANNTNAGQQAFLAFFWWQFVQTNIPQKFATPFLGRKRYPLSQFPRYTEQKKVTVLKNCPHQICITPTSDQSYWMNDHRGGTKTKPTGLHR